ncbi:MAG: class I SAM-dependent methyltransferase [Candidatus Taylorbacteria bacterium]
MDTSWGKVGDWYHDLLQREGTYQSDVILPNILRLLDIKEGTVLLDLACGEGFFAREFAKKKAKVIGVDIAPELIQIAKKNSPSSIEFFARSADDLSPLSDGSVDTITIILAIQNIENAQGVFDECGRVLKKGGKIFLVLNHPAFRIPKKSSWGYEEEVKVQYRRVDAYLSEVKAQMDMEPGKKNGKKTVSFHRPLQTYFKLLTKAGFVVSRLEEWTGNAKSEPGARMEAENRARKEFPLFMMIEGVKLGANL